MGTGNVAFADFLALMAKRVADSESPAACIHAFKVITTAAPAAVLPTTSLQPALRACKLVKCNGIGWSEQVFDKENSGFVSVAEFRHIMTSMYWVAMLRGCVT